MTLGYSKKNIVTWLCDARRVLDSLDLLHIYTARDYTLQITRLVFSVTLLGNGF
jgi:hypothetical protein